MYKTRPNRWNDFDDVILDASAENTQLFQVIRINGRVLSSEAYTAVGDLFDAFDIVKGNPNIGSFVPVPFLYENTLVPANVLLL